MRPAFSLIAASSLAATGPAGAFNFNVANSNAVAARARSAALSSTSCRPTARTRSTVRPSCDSISRVTERSPASSGASPWVGVEFGCRGQARERRRTAVRLAMEDSGRVWNKCTERVELGTSGLMVSRIGFGGIMVGGQMGEEQTHEVLNHAFDKAGINWIDTSESYPHPLIEEHKFKADPIIGSWLKGRDRSKVILCTKVAGRHPHCTWLRKDGSHTRLAREQILESVEGSLERLGTDYIDMLYLGDWPDRYIPNPGDYYYKTSLEHEIALDFEEKLMVVQELMDQGMVRQVAVANETPFGVTRYCEHAIWDGLPKIACVQQEYNLLTQNKVEMDLVEACAPRQENVAIVATQTLGGGALSTKYMFERNKLDRDPNLRLNKYVGFQGRYNSERVRQKIAQYKAIAARYDLSIHQLALAFVHNKPFITASLMGATNIEQLDQNVGALDVKLPDECLAEVISVQDSYIEPMLGPSEVTPMDEYYIDETYEFGDLTDENTRFKSRVTEGYTGP
ncbi:unnamed protein product [Ascophyllum nodosum]